MDYANHPLTLGEIRSDRSGNGCDWSPRDALIAMLRDIDAGNLKLDAVFIAGLSPGTMPGGESVVFSVAATGPSQALGLIEMAKYRYQEVSLGDD